MARPDALASWERRTAWPLAAIAALFLGGYAWPILQPGLSAGLRRACGVTVWATWLLLGAEYVLRFVLADRKRAFLRRTMLDLFSLALPVMRPLRLLRLVTMLRRLDQRATATLHGRVAAYVGFSTVLAIVLSALAVLNAERGRGGANIETFGDALWWSASTVTTVGYGDRYPVTVTGRLIGVGLMICGIGLLGVVTASIASWLLGRIRELDADIENDVHAEFDELRHRLATIERLLGGLEPPHSATTAHVGASGQCCLPPASSGSATPPDSRASAGSAHPPPVRRSRRTPG